MKWRPCLHPPLRLVLVCTCLTIPFKHFTLRFRWCVTFLACLWSSCLSLLRTVVTLWFSWVGPAEVTRPLTCAWAVLLMQFWLLLVWSVVLHLSMCVYGAWGWLQMASSCLLCFRLTWVGPCAGANRPSSRQAPVYSWLGRLCRLLALQC